MNKFCQYTCNMDSLKATIEFLLFQSLRLLSMEKKQWGFKLCDIQFVWHPIGPTCEQIAQTNGKLPELSLVLK